MRFSNPLEFKFASGSDAGEFAGFASTFGGAPDSYGDVVAPGAFKATLSKHSADGSAPAMLWAHDPSEPIGKWLSMKETAEGLAVRGKLTLGTTRGKDAYALMRDGALALSIGFKTEDAERIQKGGRLLKELQLLEVSMVPMPANPRARITELKSMLLESPRNAESVLRDTLGLSAREAKRFTSGGWSALSDSEFPLDEDQARRIADRLKSLSANLKRK